MNKIVLTAGSLSDYYRNFRNKFVTFNGETRESYLEWRTEWKKNYAELSSVIRNLKLSRKACAGRTDQEREIATEYARIFSNLATFALDCRVESKVKANQNYLNMREVETV